MMSNNNHDSQESVNINEHEEEDGDEPSEGLTTREESDLERLMEQCDFTIQDAEAFTERLSREVAAMDSSNIQAIMASEARVANLMNILQISVEETLKLENRIEHYQTLLKNVRDTVFQVEMKEALVQVQSENKTKLKEELETLISQLDFPREKEYTLTDGDLTSDEGIETCLKVAQELNRAISAPVNPILTNLQGVQEQRKTLDRMQSRFGNRIANHVIAVLNFLIREYADSIINLINGADLVLPNHALFYSNLLSYAPLLKWTKKSCRPAFDRILEQYVIIMRDQYKKEIEMFFECIREKLSSAKGSTTGSHETSSVGTASRRTRSSSVTGQAASGPSDDAISSKSSEVSLSEWEDFDNWIDRMLSAIDPVCLGEQQFCVEFFDLAGPVGPGISQGVTPLTSPSKAVSKRRRSAASPTKSASPSPSQRSGQSQLSSSSTTEGMDPKKSEELRSMMSDLFETLEYELEKFTSHYNQLDGVYSMYLMVRLTQHVLSAQDTGCFLVKVYGKILILVKRNFDAFMENQKKAIEEAKIGKKQKCGVFSFVKKFESLAKQAELIFKAAGTRRTDIDRWYVVMVRGMFDAVDRLSSQHTKTPPEMVKIENYHALHDVLRGLKIPCLEQEKLEAKTRYNEAVKEYVSRYFGRPLEKLSAFFEGVQAKVAQGVKAEEVGYQMAFSKTELRKVIRDCSLKEVKKGLEEMYRKVEKHASEPESTLIQVIWRSMQEEFLSQYKSIQDMIEKCYPDANISLAFSVEDVLNVFSDIARSH